MATGAPCAPNAIEHAESRSQAHIRITGRTPCGGIARRNGGGVFRLRRVSGFAVDSVPLKMTVFWIGRELMPDALSYRCSPSRSYLLTAFPGARQFPRGLFLWRPWPGSCPRRWLSWDQRRAGVIVRPWGDLHFGPRHEWEPSLVAAGHLRELHVGGAGERLRGCERKRRSAEA